MGTFSNSDLCITSELGGTPYKSDSPRAISNPPLTQRRSLKPEYAARVGVPESDMPHDTLLGGIPYKSDIPRAIWNPPLTRRESLSALLKDISNILDFMERLKNEEDQNVVIVADHTEGLKFVLAFIFTFTQLSYSDLEQFENTMSASRQVVENLLRQILNDADNNLQCKFNIHNVLPSLMDNISDCIISCHRSKLSDTMNDEQLNFLLLNLHYISKILAEQIFPLVTQYEILQNGCGNMRDFHGLVVNGYVEQDIVKYVLPQFPLMAERLGLFLWDDRFKRGSRLFKLTHLLLKIIPIELGVMHICYTNLKASTSAEVACFIKQLLEISPGILREYLIHLQERMLTVITRSNSGARNIHVMIEFLLIILTDVPKDIIDHDKLFDLLAHVGSLTREVSTLVHDIEEKSKSKGSTNGTNRAILDLLKNMEHLKSILSKKKSPILTVGKIVVGFEEETRSIISKLTNVAKDLDVISIIDDLWDTDAWDKLKRPFPLVENGSRIILTSRDMEVGLYGKRSTDPLNLRLLRPEESWELLEKRAFGNDCSPYELLDVGKEIAENCKGLPLVDDLIAGVMGGKRKNLSGLKFEII
ncbi:hypothetical protein CQW23_30687 [Capsicum baccatum]|uniref:NB-ARC domain-containing protein n=1 Tax=Capsicum baccatum TaxID=33114 RepID=A0A2G2V9P6_CAPBA|nr:hypothetical protein CQW23_30687 [Capsicum baccatum]